jgi:hypothetical protein
MKLVFALLSEKIKANMMHCVKEQKRFYKKLIISSFSSILNYNLIGNLENKNEA